MNRILIVPGFCETHWILWPLSRTLRDAGFDVSRFRDRPVHRNLALSVDRLSDYLSEDQAASPAIVVTHSFGDWVTRQAIQRCANPGLSKLVSIAPVMTSLPMARWARRAGLGFISEVPVMADPRLAEQTLSLPPSIERLIIWGQFDVIVRQVTDDRVAPANIRDVSGTHLSIVLQPRVHCMIRDFCRQC